MKHIIQSATPEQAEYTCDVSGKKFNEFGAPTVITIENGYGSTHDGDTYELHLSEEAAHLLFAWLEAYALRAPLPQHVKGSMFGLSDPINISMHDKATLQDQIQALRDGPLDNTPKLG